MSEANQTESEIPEDETPADAAAPAPEADEAGVATEFAFEEDPVTALEAEIEGLKDQLLRSRAEMENIRRRAEKDKADGAAYGITAFARDILTVSDNLRRALDAAPEDPDGTLKDFVTGVDLTERELLSVLERHGVKRVAPEVGDKFDPNLHQAMFEVPTTDYPNGAIMQVVGAGYVIKDRLLRPAMVGVAKNDQAADHIDTNA